MNVPRAAATEPRRTVVPRTAASSAYAPDTDKPATGRRAGERQAAGCPGGVTGGVFGALIESAAAVTVKGAVLR
jgi:hypothetical protein